METVVAIMSAGGFVACVEFIKFLIERKDKKKGKTIENVVKKQDEQEKKIDGLIQVTAISTADRIRFIGESYVKKGEISMKDKAFLHEYHKAYKAAPLYGDGYADAIMEEVDKLPIKKE